MRSYQINNIVFKEGKYYVAQCLNVEVSSFGRTRKEALLNLQEALELYFEGEKSPPYSKVENPEIITSTLKCA